MQSIIILEVFLNEPRENRLTNQRNGKLTIEIVVSSVSFFETASLLLLLKELKKLYTGLA